MDTGKFNLIHIANETDADGEALISISRSEPGESIGDFIKKDDAENIIEHLKRLFDIKSHANN